MQVSYIYWPTHVFMYAYEYMYLDMHGHIQCACMYINTYILEIQMYVSMYVCIHICTYMYICYMNVYAQRQTSMILYVYEYMLV